MAEKWAFEDDSDVADFHDRVPDMVLKYPFELDAFQKRAVLHVHHDECVFVAAHTSAGKTAVAEYAIACAIESGQRAIYTSPIKALSNQKYRDFKNKFGNVGIVTGDVRVNPEAACLIMTTEILRSMLYRNDEIINTVRWVIFDEVHYINDSERGVVWEESIIMLPQHASIVMLSATVPNYLDFASWVGRTRRKPVYCVKTDWRPVPLSFHISLNDKLYPLTGADAKFDSVSCRRAFDDAAALVARNKKTKNADQRERTEQQRLYHLLIRLSNDDLLPAAVFVFSRAKLEKLANSLTTLDLLSASEKSRVHLMFKKALAAVAPVDLDLPQIQAVKELASRGIGIHHGGLLPILKEATEILFSQGLIKVLFATETFAMGINMPTRTVIFSSLRKHDGGKFRYLHSTEFTQMSGRAGRRGLDTVGTVYLFVANEEQMPDYQSLIAMMTKKSSELRSQFRITFEMLLQFSRQSHLRVEDMMGRSFLESNRAEALPQAHAEISRIKEELRSIPKVNCLHCVDLEAFHSRENQLRETSAKLFSSLSNRKELFKCGRLVRAYRSPSSPSEAAVITNVSAGKVTLKFLSDSISRASSAEAICLICEGVVLDVDGVHVDERFNVPANLGKLSLDDHELLEKVRPLWVGQQGSPCSHCPDLSDHFTFLGRSSELQKSLGQLEAMVDERSMRLLPQRQAMERVLQKLGYVESDLQLTFKGKAAVEMLNADELTLAEIIFENVLHESLDIPTVVAVVAAFVAGNDGTPELDFNVAKRALPASVVSVLHAVAKIHREVIEKQLKEERVQIVWEEFDKQVCFGASCVAYEWASGRPFSEIMADPDCVCPDGDKQLQEGSIARIMVRTDELLRKACLAMDVIGSKALKEKLEACREAIRRDIAFGMSLYIRGNEDD